MKAKTLLVAAVMFLGLAAAAYAQATYTVSSTPVTTVTKTGMTEKAGSITFTPVQPPVAAATGTIQVTFGGVPITNAGATITNPDGSLCVAANCPVVPAGGIDYTNGIVVINITAGWNAAFTLTGVRVQISGTPLTFLNAQISAVNNFIVAGQTTPTVITAVGDGIVLGTSTAADVNIITGKVNANPEIIVNEGYLNAFGVARNGVAAKPNDQTNGVVIRFTLSAAPPKGYTITFPGTVNAVVKGGDVASGAVFQTVTVADNTDGTTKSVTASGADVAIDNTSSGSDLQIYYELTSDSDSTKLESMDFEPVVAYSVADGGLPVPSGNVTWTATLTPIGVGLVKGAPPAGALVPRYAVAEIGPGTLIGAPTGQNQTDILIPYAARIVVSGWDTGIAISNTTKDPGTKKLSFTGGVQQTGALHFYFYNTGAASSPLTYDTAAGSPGTGLDATGKLPPGATYAVNLSELLKAASGADQDFSGYIFVITDFGLAHAQYLLTDYVTVANGGQGMVISNNRVSPEALNH